MYTGCIAEIALINDLPGLHRRLIARFRGLIEREVGIIVPEAIAEVLFQRGAKAHTCGFRHVDRNDQRLGFHSSLTNIVALAIGHAIFAPNWVELLSGPCS